MFDPRLLDLHNPIPGIAGCLGPELRKDLFSYLSVAVRRSLITYQLGVMRLQDIVSGMFREVALSKPDARKVANGFFSMFGVRRAGICAHFAVRP